MIVFFYFWTLLLFFTFITIWFEYLSSFNVKLLFEYTVFKRWIKNFLYYLLKPHESAWFNIHIGRKKSSPKRFPAHKPNIVFIARWIESKFFKHIGTMWSFVPRWGLYFSKSSTFHVFLFVTARCYYKVSFILTFVLFYIFFLGSTEIAT